MAQMLTLYRRHQKSCPHRSEGRQYRRCKCPVWVDGLLSGSPIRQSLDTRSWEKATATIRDWELEGRITVEEQKQIEVEQACASFTSDAKARGLSAGTIKKYRVLLDQLKAFCGEHGLRFVHVLDLDWLRQFRETWTDSNISALKKLERLKSVSRFWHESGWMAENYAKAIRPPKVTEGPTLPFTRDEIAALLEAVGKLGGTDLTRQRMRALILTLRYAGLRIGDAVRLHESRVQGKRIRLYTQKTGTHDEVPLPPFLLDRLADLQTHAGFYFVPGKGRASTSAGNYRRTFRRLAKLAGMEGAHPHQFRDTFAVELLQKGVPIGEVSVLLGHRSVKITEKHYAPWVKSRQDALERNVERSWEGETEPGMVVKFRKAG